MRAVRTGLLHVGVGARFAFNLPLVMGDGGCGRVTRLSREIAVAWAQNPRLHSNIFCVHCHEHLPLEEFVWEGTCEELGRDAA